MTPWQVVILVLLCALGLGMVYILIRLLRLENAPADLVHLREMAQRQDMTGSSLIETTNEIRSELISAQRDLAALQSELKARQELERRNADALRRMEMVIAGTQSKGAAGEHILEAIFSQLPAEWQVRNYRVRGGVVEFGLRLPNGMVLPIDSKIPATEELARFHAAETDEIRQKLKGDIEKEVLRRVAEVRKYLDPDLTIGLGLAVVPDGVYELCGAVLGKASAVNVLVINYSLFLPYILLTYKIALAASADIDHYRLEGYLRGSEELIGKLEARLTGSYDASIRQLGNSRDEMLGMVSQLRAGLLNLRQFSIAEVSEPYAQGIPGTYNDKHDTHTDDGREP